MSFLVCFSLVLLPCAMFAQPFRFLLDLLLELLLDFNYPAMHHLWSWFSLVNMFVHLPALSPASLHLDPQLIPSLEAIWLSVFHV